MTAETSDAISTGKSPAERATTIVKATSGPAGSSFEALMNQLFPGPVGAIGGAVGGHLMTSGMDRLADHVKEQLDARAGVRIEAFRMALIRTIVDNEQSGCQLRGDGFLKDDSSGRSGATELAEAVMRTVWRESQEPKIPYFAHLYGSFLVRPEVSREDAVSLVRLGERLTYRQLCLLALLIDRDKFGLTGPTFAYGNRVNDQRKLSTLQEIGDLSSMGLVNAKLQYGPTVLTLLTESSEDRHVVLEMGRVLHTHMNLRTIPRSDVEAVATLVRPS